MASRAHGGGGPMASRAHGRLRGRRTGGAGARRGGRGATAGAAGPAGRAGWTEAPPPRGRGGPAGPLARWVDEMVIGWGLCPFAEPARDRTRFVELAPPNAQKCADTAEAAAFVRAGIAEELRLLAREPPGRPATTLVAVDLRPEAAFTFEEFMLLVVLPLQALAGEGRNEFGETLLGTGREGGGCGIQCVPFHPEASYGEGAEADWATRAPVPAVHLLRDCDVEAAELQWEAAGLDPADIHRDNVKRLRAVGASRAAAAVRACVKPEPCPAGEGAISEAADATRTEAAARALLVEAASAGADAGNITLRRVGPSGWGAVAVRNLQWNDVLLTLPRGALRTPADAEAAGVGGTGHPAGDLASLVLFERSLGQESALRAYVNMLPTLETFRAHHPLCATEEELVACLGRNTLVGSEAVARRREALGLAGAVRKACGSGPSALEDDAMWALTIVSSRAFHLDLPDEGSSLCLCPVADMLNHSEAASAQRRARLQWDSDTNVAVVRAFRDFDAGEEVFDSFGGTLSVSDAFLRYGFAAGVGIERITVPLGRLGPCRSQAGQSVLAAANLENAELVFTAEGPDEVGLACLAASEATEEELRAAGWGTGEAEGVLARLCAGIEQPWARKLATRTQTRLARELQGLLSQHDQRSEWSSADRPPWQVEARVALESECCVLQAAAASAVAQADALS